MKIKLMVQSLSPLALLTVVRNLNFITTNEIGEKVDKAEFVSSNLVLLIVIALCLIWVILSIWFWIEFKAFNWAGKKSGYEIINVENNEESSLNFFLTIIIPLLIDNVDTVQGAITFLLIVVMLSILLYRTRLFYANPVLAFLGYYFYKFEFKSNNEETGKCLCVSRSKLELEMVIEYKKIADNVFYVKESK